MVRLIDSAGYSPVQIDRHLNRLAPCYIAAKPEPLPGRLF